MSRTPAPSAPAPARRESILDAAEDLFLRQGYEGTSVHQVVQRVGIAQGTFYYHDVNDYNHIKRILYIRGSDYEEKIYASGRGLVDIYYGKVAHQADSIEMMPARRNTRMREERPSGSGYSTPSYTMDNFVPVSDWRKVNEGRIKYFLFYVDDKLYLTVERPLSSNEERRAQFKRVSWVYIRKQ